MEPEIIPRFLDEPEKMMFFSIQEIGVFILLFGTGVAIQLALFGLFLAILGVIGVKYLKRNGFLEVIFYYLYWYFPSRVLRMMQIQIDGLPPSAYRVMSG